MTAVPGEGAINWPKATGLKPAFSVAITLFVAVSIMEMVFPRFSLLPQFATYTFVPSGVTAIP